MGIQCSALLQTCVLGIVCSDCAQRLCLANVNLQALWRLHQLSHRYTGVLIGCATGHAHSNICIVLKLLKLASLHCCLSCLSLRDCPRWTEKKPYPILAFPPRASACVLQIV